jgi:signal transduction histidine kinase
MALAAEKSKMNTMVEKMSEGIIMFGENDQLVILNAIARDLLGCSGTVDQSMLLYCLREIKLLESLDEIRNAYPASWMKEVRVDNTYTRVIRAEGLQILDETQRPLGIVIIMRDVTRERQTDQLKNDFIAMVSHELRTPLVAVKAATATLLGQSAGQMNERQQHLLAIAKNNMQRLEKLIDALLDVAKIEAGQMAVFGQPTDIVGLIDDTVHIFEASARERHVRLFWDPPSGIPPIVIDGDKITQVVSNLLGNAVKFTPPGGCITVTVSYENSMIRVKVADTGLGIPQADLGKIFDKFYQVTRKTDERVGSGGTGLGLTICKAIVEKHGGSIWVESKVGKGSTFCFTLPARLEGST